MSLFSTILDIDLRSTKHDSAPFRLTRFDVDEVALAKIDRMFRARP